MFERLKAMINDKGRRQEWYWPIPSGGTLQSCYAPRRAVNPDLKGALVLHPGIDLTHPDKEVLVRAIDDGYVIRAEMHPLYGYMVVLAHKGGIYSLYAHLDPKLPSNVGQEVVFGNVIGRMGTSGLSTARHLHLQVHRGKAFPERFGNLDPSVGKHFDPLTLLQNWRDYAIAGAMVEDNGKRVRNRLA
jgi:murein DD-endopeptidase MepM/ murein hydrolase activator NlpD